MTMVNCNLKPITRMVKLMDYLKLGMKMVNWNTKAITRMVNGMDYLKLGMRMVNWNPQDITRMGIRFFRGLQTTTTRPPPRYENSEALVVKVRKAVTKSNKMKVEIELEYEMLEYRTIPLEDGGYIQVKYDVEGIVYDKFDKHDEFVESYGYDFYFEINNIKNR